MAETIERILDRVGSDASLAAEELANERDRSSPRKTLVARLEQIVAAGDGSPVGLGAKSVEMWREITTVYDLRPDELRILEDACREMDLIDRISRALESEPLIVTGSQGQDVSNPLVSEIRQHRATLKSLLASLKLPDDSAPQTRSVQARSAAQARWAGGS